jgi:hypothetical protein
MGVTTPDIAGLCERPRTVSLQVTFPLSIRNPGGRDTRSDIAVGIASLPEMLLECERLLRALPEGVGDDAGEFKLLNARLVPEGIMFSVTLEDNTIERQAAEIERLRRALRRIRDLDTRTHHDGYDNGLGGGNYIYRDVIFTDEAFPLIDAALTGEDA